MKRGQVLLTLLGVLVLAYVAAGAVVVALGGPLPGADGISKHVLTLPSMEVVALYVVAPLTGIALAYASSLGVLSAIPLLPHAGRSDRFLSRGASTLVRFASTLPVTVVIYLLLVAFRPFGGPNSLDNGMLFVCLVTIVTGVFIATSVGLVQPLASSRVSEALIAGRGAGMTRAQVAGSVFRREMRPGLRRATAFAVSRVVVEVALVIGRAPAASQVSDQAGSSQVSGYLDLLNSGAALRDSYWILLLLFAAAVGLSFVGLRSP